MAAPLPAPRARRPHRVVSVIGTRVSIFELAVACEVFGIFRPEIDGWCQSQFVETPVPACAEDDPLGPVLVWMAEHLDVPMTVDELARRATLSPRTFARRFVAATGTTPLQWLLTQRVARARGLLETTDLPVERVAQACGFGTAAGLRTHFARVLGTSPTTYRRRFACPLAG